VRPGRALDRCDAVIIHATASLCAISDSGKQRSLQRTAHGRVYRELEKGAKALRLLPPEALRDVPDTLPQRAIRRLECGDSSILA